MVLAELGFGLWTLKGLVNPDIIWNSNRLFSLLLILLNVCHLGRSSETLPKTPASLGLIYGVINVRLSVDMGAWDNRWVAPKKQIVLIKVKDIPYSLSVERHSSHVMLTLPPCFPLSLSLSPSACLAVGGACKGWKKKLHGWTNIDTNSLCEWRCTNLWVIQSWNNWKWINWTLKGLQHGVLNGQTVGDDTETDFFYGSQESGIQTRLWIWIESTTIIVCPLRSAHYFL